MDTIDTNEWADVIDRVKNGPASSRIALAERILNSLIPPASLLERKQIRSVEDMRVREPGDGTLPMTRRSDDGVTNILWRSMDEIHTGGHQ